MNTLRVLSTIFIIFVLGPANAWDLSIQFAYDSREVKVTVGGKTEKLDYFFNRYLHPAARLTLFYLDLVDSKTLLSSHTFNDHIRKAVWERNLQEVEAEFENDKNLEIEYQLAKKKWDEEKRKRKPGDKAPVPPSQEIDPKISASLNLFLINLGPKDLDSLKFKVIDMSINEVIVVMFRREIFELVWIHDSSNGNPGIQLQYNQGLTENQSFDFFNSVHKPPKVTDAATNKPLVSSGWILPADRVAFFIYEYSTPSYFRYQKVMVENGQLSVEIYQKDPEFLLESTVEDSSARFQITSTQNVFIQNLKLPLAQPTEMRVLFQSKTGPLMEAYRCDLKKGCNLNFETGVASWLKSLFLPLGRMLSYFRLGENTLDLEVNTQGDYTRKGLVAKLVDIETDFRISIYNMEAYLANNKNAFLLPKKQCGKFKLFWTSVDNKAAVPFAFDRKIPIDLGVLKKSHYSEFVFSEPLFNSNGYIPATEEQAARAPRNTPFDFAWVTNAADINFNSYTSDVMTYQTDGETCSHYIYSRSQGLFVKTLHDKVTLIDFTISNKVYKKSLDLQLPYSNYGMDMAVDFAMFDVHDNFSRSNFDSFPVIRSQLYFLKLQTSMQDFISEKRVEVCKQAMDKLTLCGFSAYDGFRVNVHPQSFELVTGVQSRVFPFKSYKPAWDVLLVDQKGCTMPTKTMFTGIVSEHVERAFFLDKLHVPIDPKKSLAHCPAYDKCFLILVQADRPELSEDVLSKLKVDPIARTCSVPTLNVLELKFEKGNLIFKRGSIKIGWDGEPGSTVLRLMKPIHITKQHTKLQLGKESVDLKCLNIDGTNECRMIYATFSHQKQAIIDQFLGPKAHPLNLPLLYSSETPDSVILETYYQPGTISIIITMTSLELYTDDTGMGYVEFNRVKIYQSSRRFWSGSTVTVKLFLFDLVPVVIPIVLKRDVDFTAAPDAGAPLGLEGFIEGNVEPNFVYDLYRFLLKRPYSLYAIENSSGQMELLVYPSGVVGAFEIIDNFCWGELDDLILSLKDRTRIKEQEAKLEFKVNLLDEGVSDKYFFAEADNREFFHVVPTAFKGVTLLLGHPAIFKKNGYGAIPTIPALIDAKETGKLSGFIFSSDVDPQYFRLETNRRLI